MGSPFRCEGLFSWRFGGVLFRWEAGGVGRGVCYRCRASCVFYHDHGHLIYDESEFRGVLLLCAIFLCVCLDEDVCGDDDDYAP